MFLFDPSIQNPRSPQVMPLPSICTLQRPATRVTSRHSHKLLHLVSPCIVTRHNRSEARWGGAGPRPRPKHGLPLRLPSAVPSASCYSPVLAERSPDRRSSERKRAIHGSRNCSLANLTVSTNDSSLIISRRWGEASNRGCRRGVVRVK